MSDKKDFAKKNPLGFLQGDSIGFYKVSNINFVFPNIAVKVIIIFFHSISPCGLNRLHNKIADNALQRLDVDNYGLDAFDRRYLNCILQNLVIKKDRQKHFFVVK